MKKPSRFVVILYGACAVIWTARAVLEVVYQTYYDSVFSVPYYGLAHFL